MNELIKYYGMYVVIKILNNDDDIEKWVCIPKSWIKTKDNTSNLVVFGYPLEDELDIQMRVINYEPLDDYWPPIYGDVVFDTDSQTEAFQYHERITKELKTDFDQTEDTSKECNKQDDKKSQFTSTDTKKVTPIKICLSKTRRPSSGLKESDDNSTLRKECNFPNMLNTINEWGKSLKSDLFEAEKLILQYGRDLDNEETVFSTTSNCSLKSQTAVTTEKLLNKTDIFTAEPPANEENFEKNMVLPRRKSTRQSRNLSKSYTEYSDEDYESSDDLDCIYLPDRSSTSSQELVVSKSNVRVSNSSRPKTTGQSVLAFNNAQNQEIDINQLNNQVISDCYDYYVELNASYQKNMSILEDAAAYLRNLIITHKDNDATIEKLPSPLPTNRQLDAVNNNTFVHLQPLLQERQSTSTENTKWTIRYPEPGRGLIELLPNTGVYVSKNGLNKCKTTRKNTGQFTIGLLEQVFTDEALKKCSFTGARTKHGKKPGLDVNARDTLCAYVLNYSLNKGWKKADPDIIITCIRSRLQTLKQ